MFSVQLPRKAKKYRKMIFELDSNSDREDEFPLQSQNLKKKLSDHIEDLDNIKHNINIHQSKTELPEDVQFQIVYDHNNQFDMVDEDDQMNIGNEIEEHNNNISTPYETMKKKKKLCVKQNPLSLSLESLYSYGRLREDTEQLLPTILKVKSNYQYGVVKETMKYENCMHHICVFDQQINKNEIRMISMKNALKTVLKCFDNMDLLSLFCNDHEIKQAQQKNTLADNINLIDKINIIECDEFILSKALNATQKLLEQNQNQIKIYLFITDQVIMSKECLQFIEQYKKSIQFSFILFGNQRDFNYLNMFTNCSYTHIYNDKTLNQYISQNFYQTQDKLIQNLEIEIIGGLNQNIDQICIKCIHNSFEQQQPRPNDLLTVSVIPPNYEFSYQIDCLLPKSNGCNINKILIYEVFLSYTYQNIKYQESKQLQIRILQSDETILSDSLNLEPAILYYNQLCLFQFLKDLVEQKNDTQKSLMIWLYSQINKNPELKNNCKQSLQLLENYLQ